MTPAARATRRGALLAVAGAAIVWRTSRAAIPESWAEVAAAAQGQTVYFHAWGGSQPVNTYLEWVATRLATDHGVTLRHVKLTDTDEAVARVTAEKSAGRTSGGSVDLVWINGENFAAMKREGLLFGPFAERLPNAALVDPADPTTRLDAGEPTAGLESPWGTARFVLLRDTARMSTPPRSMAELLAWAQRTPGRFTYPQPPEFLGTTFLKQAMLELAPDRTALAQPMAAGTLDRVAAPLWAYLEALHPVCWRGGTTFPSTGPQLRQLLADGELDLASSFDPQEAASGIRQGFLPDTVRVSGLDVGTIGNTHFVAIPFDATAREGAMVVADFLLSPEAQARKADARFWGNGTALAPGRLSAEQRRFFEAIPAHPADPDPAALGPALAEPHASWTEPLESGWQRRWLAR